MNKESKEQMLYILLIQEGLAQDLQVGSDFEAGYKQGVMSAYESVREVLEKFEF